MASLLHKVSKTNAINLHTCSFLDPEDVLAARVAAKGLVSIAVLEEYSRRWLIRLELFEDKEIIQLTEQASPSARKKLLMATTLFVGAIHGMSLWQGKASELHGQWRTMCPPHLFDGKRLFEKKQMVLDKLRQYPEIFNSLIYKTICSRSYSVARIALEARIPAYSATIEKAIVRGDSGLSLRQLAPFFSLGGADLTWEGSVVLLASAVKTPDDIQVMSQLLAGDAPYRKNSALVNCWSTCHRVLIGLLGKQTDVKLVTRFYEALHRGGMSATKLLFVTSSCNRHTFMIPTLFAWGAKCIATQKAEPYYIQPPIDPDSDHVPTMVGKPTADHIDSQVGAILTVPNTSVLSYWAVAKRAPDKRYEPADPSVYKLLRAGGATPTIDDLVYTLECNGPLNAIETFLKDGVKPDENCYQLAAGHKDSARILTLFSAALAGRTN